jgi:hypothetical protein
LPPQLISASLYQKVIVVLIPLFLQKFILMHHEGNFHLDDVRYLNDDNTLKSRSKSHPYPQVNTLGSWLRKMGDNPHIKVLDAR